MQESWVNDPNKETFILLDRSLQGEDGGAMAGDVNLYWNDADDAQAAEIEACQPCSDMMACNKISPGCICMSHALNA